mmetsp:Transcript_12489/g.35761  ORF Transcript_12489/g.35761 Transcript_12489/m.35761 type:complete len:269 (+) Transcript_12489:482-1288(+)
MQSSEGGNGGGGSSSEASSPSWTSMCTKVFFTDIAMGGRREPKGLPPASEPVEFPRLRRLVRWPSPVGPSEATAATATTSPLAPRASPARNLWYSARQAASWSRGTLGGMISSGGGKASPLTAPRATALLAFVDDAISPLAPLAWPARKRWYSRRKDVSLVKSITFGTKSRGGGNCSSPAISLVIQEARLPVSELAASLVAGVPTLAKAGAAAAAPLPALVEVRGFVGASSTDSSAVCCMSRASAKSRALTVEISPLAPMASPARNFW